MPLGICAVSRRIDLGEPKRECKGHVADQGIYLSCGPELAQFYGSLGDVPNQFASLSTQSLRISTLDLRHTSAGILKGHAGIHTRE